MKKSKTIKTRKKKKKVVKQSEPLSKEEKIRRRRLRQQQKEESERRRGKIIDFTKLRAGTKSMRNHTIIKCKECGKTGESTNLGLSVLILHRGFAKPGDMIRTNDGQEVQRISMSNWCLV